MNLKGEPLGLCHMWCAVELVKEATRKPRGLGFESHALQERSPGFKLFCFVLRMGFSLDCVTVGKPGLKPVEHEDQATSKQNTLKTFFRRFIRGAISRNPLF